MRLQNIIVKLILNDTQHWTIMHCMERENPILGDPNHLQNEFEGVGDPQFKEFLVSAKSRLAGSDEFIGLNDMLHHTVDLLYPDIEETEVNPLVAKLRNKLKRLENLPLIPIIPVGEKNGRIAVHYTTQDGALNAVSFLYAKNALDEGRERGHATVPESLLKAAELFGTNSRAAQFRVSIDNFSQGVEELFSEEGEKRQRRESKREMLLEKIPPYNSALFSQFDTQALLRSMKAVERAFPKWRLESAEWPIERYPLHPEVIQAVRFIVHVDKNQLAAFKVSEGPVAVGEVVRSLQYVSNVITQYEVMLRKTDQTTKNDIKLSLNNIFRVRAEMVRKVAENLNS